MSSPTETTVRTETIAVDATVLQELRGKAAAVDRAQAVIEFDLDGVILAANANFLAVVGYTLGEVVGHHHRMFVDPATAASAEYAQFWEGLRGGAFETGEYKRLTKSGSEVWLQATYNPVLDTDGNPFKVVKFAADVTATKLSGAEAAGKMAAVDRAQAVIEFDLDGRVLNANANFLSLMGYTAAEVVGKHHRVFVDTETSESREYADFWEALRAGSFESGEYKRLAKGAREVWLQATYNPILDTDGNPFKVVKFASDVTATKLRNAEIAGRMAAVDRAQATIEFDLDGVIVAANSNFLSLMGYNAAEVVGKHHRMFVEPTHVVSQEYADFWDGLREGTFASGEYKRLAKGGREVWIQATYNPILDTDGNPFKVVKFASDVTATKLRNAEIAGRVEAIGRAQAVIEFDLDGIVLAANDNFLRAMGFQMREIIGRHHSDFCTEEYTRGEEYRDFWLRLSKGELISGRYHRVGKYNRDVYLQATYNPILDLSGNPTKVVKYAYDVTAQVQREQRIATDTKKMTGLVSDLSGSIGQIASSSSTATDLAAETHTDAEGGVLALRASLEAIALIQKSSHSISEIVRVMGEIANQTNLLAFNASIEAARAGEHGVGFSIVAGEVRKLAERSFEAAQQIGALIDESAERVEQGSEVSKRAEGAFERIVAGVERTSEAIATIVALTREQQDASEEVSALVTALAAADENA